MDRRNLQALQREIEKSDNESVKDNLSMILIQMINGIVGDDSGTTEDSHSSTSNVNVYTAPDLLPADEPQTYTVFLAGGITGCWEWQTEAIRLFSSMSDRLPPGVTLNLLNPRRENFPKDDPDAAKEQIWWEQRAIEAADTVLFWFTKDTVQPIVLLELGRVMERAAYSQMAVGVEKGYVREQDVLLQVWYRHPLLTIHDNLADVVASAIDHYTKEKKRND